MTAGMIIIRTTKASKATAAARPKPIEAMSDSPLKMNAANTLIMMSAAATTTREECA